VLTTGGLTDSIEAIGLLDCSVLNSDHRALFIDLCIENIFGPSPEKLAQLQYRNLKLDDPRISEEDRQIIHKKFEDKHKTLDALGFARKVHLATIPRE
jgi:hypothetical protein